MIKQEYFRYVSMISFGYLKLTVDISMAFIRYDCRLWNCARAHFYHAFLRRCFDNTLLLKQLAYRNRRLLLGRYYDVSSCENEETTVVYTQKYPIQLNAYCWDRPTVKGQCSLFTYNVDGWGANRIV